MTALRLSLSQTNLFSPQHLAASRPAASRPDRGQNLPQGRAAAERWKRRPGAAGSAQSDPLISPPHAQELHRPRAWHSADSKTQSLLLQEVPPPLRARQQGLEEPEQLNRNTTLFTSLLYRFETGDSHFCRALCKINSQAQQ